MPRIVKLSETRWRVQLGKGTYYVKQLTAPCPARMDTTGNVHAQVYGTYVVDDDHTKRVEAMTPEDAVVVYLQPLFSPPKPIGTP